MIKYNNYIVFLYIIAFVVVFVQIYYSFVEADSFGLGIALYGNLFLLITTIIGFVYYSFYERRLQWFYFIPFIISLIPLIIVYMYYN